MVFLNLAAHQNHLGSVKTCTCLSPGPHAAPGVELVKQINKNPGGSNVKPTAKSRCSVNHNRYNSTPKRMALIYVNK